MKTSTDSPASDDRASRRAVKCVVWDLDNTLWKGVLAEDDDVTLRNGVRDILAELDRRGILLSIASNNDYEPAMRKLKSFGVAKYFLYPQIDWNSKADSVRRIAEAINIGIDALAFIDDREFERKEVAFSHPEVVCIDAADVDGLLDRPDMNPRFVTPESRKRREMYESAQTRSDVEENFDGPKQEFLETLDMHFTIGEAQEEDLQRAEELTVRTNQLNSTGYTYSYDELDGFRTSDDHKLLVSRLDDTFGTYGTIGLALIHVGPETWTLKLLLMSCRVMSRGVGTMMLGVILRQAQKAGARVHAEFVPTDRNRRMYVTYKFAGFEEVERTDEHVLLAHDVAEIQPLPDYATITYTDGSHSESLA